MLKTEVVNVRVPREIVKKLDEIIDKDLYSSRSEIIRQFLREYISERKGGRK